MGFVYPLCMFVYHAIFITNKKNLNLRYKPELMEMTLNLKRKINK